MGGLDPAKLLMVLLVALIVLGPEKLPRVARQLAGIWRELGKMRERFEAEVREALPDIDIPQIPRLPSRGITGYLTSMMTSTTPGAAAGGAFSSEVVEDGAAQGFSREVVEDGAAQGFSREESDVLPTQAWVSSSSGPDVDVAEGVPAGWNAVGAQAPGYASGSVLAPVPSVSLGGPMTVESELSFDEPGWN